VSGKPNIQVIVHSRAFVEIFKETSIAHLSRRKSMTIILGKKISVAVNPLLEETGL